MPRGLWNGTLTFGMVQIPVRLHPGVVSRDLDLDLLDRRDMGAVGYVKVNKRTGEEVPASELVKARKYEDQYVVLSQGDFERARVKGTQAIEIEGFVNLDQIKPLFYDTPYYLEPSGKDSRPYGLLREALASTRKAGIAKVVIRTRERLCAVFADGALVVLNTIRYAHELRDRKELKLPPLHQEFREQELAMARKLIEGMLRPWRPEEYRDEYREEMLRYIREKAEAGKGHEIVSAPKPAREQKAPSADLMSLLKESVEKAEAGKARRGRTA